MRNREKQLQHGSIKKEARASLTVEASFVVTIVLIAILWIMQASIELYQQTVETAALEWLDTEQAANRFRQMYLIKEVVE